MQIRFRLQGISDTGNGGRNVTLAPLPDQSQPMMPMFGGPIALNLNDVQAKELGLDTNTIGAEFLVNITPAPKAATR